MIQKWAFSQVELLFWWKDSKEFLRLAALALRSLPTYHFLHFWITLASWSPSLLWTSSPKWWNKHISNHQNYEWMHLEQCCWSLAIPKRISLLAKSNFSFCNNWDLINCNFVSSSIEDKTNQSFVMLSHQVFATLFLLIHLGDLQEILNQCKMCEHKTYFIDLYSFLK